MNKLSILYFMCLLIPLNLLAQEIEISHGPYIQALSAGEVTIVWTTTANAVSWVDIAPASSNSFYHREHPKHYQTKNGNKVIGKLHRVTIKGLQEGSSYQYRVFSREVLSHKGNQVLYGNVASTDVYKLKPLSFTTLDEDKKSVSFCIFNDIHGRNEDLKALAKGMEIKITDLVFFNGDMVTSMNNEQQFFEDFMDNAVKLFAAEVPVFYSRGNHETRGPFSSEFSEYFPTSDGKLYYSFRHGPVYFIVLDCGEDKPDSDIEYYDIAQFDEYRSEQQEWLNNVVETEAFKSAPYKIAVIHMPPVGSDWHGPLDIQRKLLPGLNNKGLTAMFCGHLHRFEYLEPDDQKHDFPILINAHNSCLEVKASLEKMIIIRRDTEGNVLDKIEL